MKKPIEDLSAAIAIFVFLALLCVSFYYVGDSERKRAFQSGYDANKAGVRAEANPYSKDKDSVHWLNGWVQSEKERKQ